MSPDRIAAEARDAITPEYLASQIRIGYAGHGSDGVMRRLMLDTTTGRTVLAPVCVTLTGRDGQCIGTAHARSRGVIVEGDSREPVGGWLIADPSGRQIATEIVDDLSVAHRYAQRVADRHAEVTA